MIGIIAKLRTKEGQADAFATQSAQMAKTVAAKEPENIFYNCYRDQNDPNLFVALELYENPAAMEAHGASDHVAESMKTVPDMLDGDRHHHTHDAEGQGQHQADPDNGPGDILQRATKQWGIHEVIVWIGGASCRSGQRPLLEAPHLLAVENDEAGSDDEG